MRTSSEHYRGQTSRFWCACVYQYFFSSVAFYAPLCVPGSVTVKQVLIVLAVTVKHTYMKYWGALLLNRDLSLLHLSLILNLYLSTKACFTNTQRHQASFLSYFPPLQNPSAVSFFFQSKTGTLYNSSTISAPWTANRHCTVYFAGSWALHVSA